MSTYYKKLNSNLIVSRCSNSCDDIIFLLMIVFERIVEQYLLLNHTKDTDSSIVLLFNFF